MKSVKTTVVTFILGHLDIYKYRMYRLDIHGAYVNVCYQHEILLSMNCSFRLTIKVYSKNTIKLKTKHTALPEQFQNKTYCTARTVPKQNILHCQNSSKTKHTALPEQFQNKTYCTARTVPKQNILHCQNSSKI